MNSKKKRSSRKRMDHRIRHKNRSTPSVYFVDQKLDSGQVAQVRVDANRAAKRVTASFQAHVAGQSARQEQNDKRKANRKSTARALRKMRKETQQAMRAAGGF